MVRHGVPTGRSVSRVLFFLAGDRTFTSRVLNPALYMKIADGGCWSPPQNRFRVRFLLFFLSYKSSKCIEICCVCINLGWCILTFTIISYIVGVLARCPCVAQNIKILWEKRMNQGMPYLQKWRGGAGKLPQFRSYPSDINRTAYIAGWQAHHHHQLCFLSLLARCPCVARNIKMHLYDLLIL